MHTPGETVKHKLNRLAETSTSSQVYRTSLIELLREAIPFDGACCTAVDPHTLLSIGAVTEEGIEAIHHDIFEYEYLREDINAYDQLAKSANPVASICGTTNGNPERCARYREVLLPAGFVDEMRAALVYDGACWGYLTLFRRQGSSLFQEDELKWMAALVPLLGSHLRRFRVSLPSAEDLGFEEEPGIWILSDRLAPLSSNPAADRWLSSLRRLEQIDSLTIPRPIRAVCSRALSEEAAGSSGASSAKVCIRIPEGPYLTLRACVLQGPGTKHLAVWIELAKAQDVLPLISEAYGLSEREKQILDGIVRGLSTKALASTYHITTYTVQDHLKSIFAKTGVTSRRELIWQLFTRFSVRI